MGMENIPGKLREGLKKWAKARKTSTIAKHLEGKVDDPQAVAVAVRKDAIGLEAFRANQRKARKNRPCGG